MNGKWSCPLRLAVISSFLLLCITVELCLLLARGDRFTPSSVGLITQVFEQFGKLQKFEGVYTCEERSLIQFLKVEWGFCNWSITNLHCFINFSVQWRILLCIPSIYNSMHLCIFVCSVRDRLCASRLLSPWNFPSKNTGKSCHFLPQAIFLTHGSNQSFRHLPHWQANSLPLCPLGSPLLVPNSRSIPP